MVLLQGKNLMQIKHSGLSQEGNYKNITSSLKENEDIIRKKQNLETTPHLIAAISVGEIFYDRHDFCHYKWKFPICNSVLAV